MVCNGCSGAGFCALLTFRCAWPPVRPPALSERGLLDRGRVREATAQRRAGLLKLFEEWLEPRVDPFTLVEMARHHGSALNEWLAEYLKHCYVSGWAMGRAAETVNAVQTSYPWLRGSLAGPWGLLRTWHMLEPPEVHPPAPRSVVEAMAAVALSCKWWRVATILLTGIWALLRPKECWSLSRGSFCASARAPARQHDLDLPRPDQGSATGTEKAVRQSRRAVRDQLLAEGLAGSPGVRTDMEWLFSNLQNQVRRHLEGAVDPDWLNPAQQSQDRRSHHAVPAVGRECAKVDVERKVAVAAHPRALRARVGCHQHIGKVEATDPKSGPQTSSPAGTGPA
mmetsp:Transcript_101717/g.326763  ORF Transcript_101717/g.326763 Transcript_101717/m.326763 type:complete len:339 (+) Transcript_101717:110-1126(+)